MYRSNILQRWPTNYCFPEYLGGQQQTCNEIVLDMRRTQWVRSQVFHGFPIHDPQLHKGNVKVLLRRPFTSADRPMRVFNFSSVSLRAGDCTRQLHTAHPATRALVTVGSDANR